MMGKLKILLLFTTAAGVSILLQQNHFAFTISPESFKDTETIFPESYTDQKVFLPDQNLDLSTFARDGVMFLRPSTNRFHKRNIAHGHQITVNSSGHLVMSDQHLVQTVTAATQPSFHELADTVTTKIFQQTHLFTTLTALLGSSENVPEKDTGSTLTASAFMTRENILMLILSLSVFVIGTFLASPQRKKTAPKERSTPHRGDPL